MDARGLPQQTDAIARRSASATHDRALRDRGIPAYNSHVIGRAPTPKNLPPTLLPKIIPITVASDAINAQNSLPLDLFIDPQGRQNRNEPLERRFERILGKKIDFHQNPRIILAQFPEEKRWAIESAWPKVYGNYTTPPSLIVDDRDANTRALMRELAKRAMAPPTHPFASAGPIGDLVMVLNLLRGNADPHDVGARVAVVSGFDEALTNLYRDHPKSKPGLNAAERGTLDRGVPVRETTQRPDNAGRTEGVSEALPSFWPAQPILNKKSLKHTPAPESAHNGWRTLPPRQPPTIRDHVSVLIQRHSKIARTEASVDALTDIFRRTGGSDDGRAPSDKARRAAAGELAAMFEILDRPQLEWLQPVPPTNTHRTPDFIAKHVGNAAPFAIEVVSSTQAVDKKGVTYELGPFLREPRGIRGRLTPSRLSRNIVRKCVPEGTVSQLATGGELFVVLTFAEMGNGRLVQKAMDSVNKHAGRFPYVNRITFLAAGARPDKAKGGRREALEFHRVGNRYEALPRIR